MDTILTDMHEFLPHTNKQRQTLLI